MPCDTHMTYTEILSLSNPLPRHVAVQEEDLQLQCLLLRDQLHALQPQPSHSPLTLQFSSLCPINGNIFQFSHLFTSYLIFSDYFHGDVGSIKIKISQFRKQNDFFFFLGRWEGGVRHKELGEFNKTKKASRGRINIQNQLGQEENKLTIESIVVLAVNLLSLPK